MRALGLTLLAIALAASLYSTAHAGKRVALVIGNSSYKNISPLPNPKNDAELITRVLREVGFEVSTVIDADRRSMGRAMRTFGATLRAAGPDAVGLFYYAGHGVQAGGVNYLIPVGATVQDDADLSIEAVSAADILRQMESAGNALNLVILDACRNNPFAGEFRSAIRGLARIQAASGSLIAYSAAPGQVARDGRGKYSPYTAALAREIRKPSSAVEQVFKNVRIRVRRVTGGKQVPWEESSLLGDFYFVERQPGTVTQKPQTTPPAPVPSEITQAWELIRDTRDIAVLKAFRAQYGTGNRFYDRLAANRIAELEKQVAALPAPETEPDETPDIEAPNAPMPANVPVDPRVLKLVETHPFFGNAPPVRLNKYASSYSMNARSSGFPGIADWTDRATDNGDVGINWLRPSITLETARSRTTSSNPWGTANITSQSSAVYAANGLIELASTFTSNTKHGPYASKNTTTEIRNLTGAVFPVQVGNAFSYEYVSRFATKGVATLSVTNTYDCRVISEHAAATFHRDLSGKAFLLHCENSAYYGPNSDSNHQTQTRKVYFTELGYWLNADPVLTSERLVSNGIVLTLPKGTRTSNITYTLKSFSTAR